MLPRSTGPGESKLPGVPLDVIDAAVQRDIVLLLAIIVVILGGAVAFLFGLIIKEMRGRTQRAEGLTDEANDLNDKLADTFRAALEELRKR